MSYVMPKEAIEALALEAAHYLDNITRLLPCNHECDPVTPETMTSEHLVGVTCWGLPQHKDAPDDIMFDDAVDFDNIEVRDKDKNITLTVSMLVYGFDFREKTPCETAKELDETGDIVIHRGEDNYFGWIKKAPELVIELANKVRIIDMNLEWIRDNCNIPRKNHDVFGMYASDIEFYCSHLCQHVYFPQVEYDDDCDEISFYEITFKGVNLREFDTMDEIVEKYAPFDPSDHHRFLFKHYLDDVIHFNYVDMEYVY